MSLGDSEYSTFQARKEGRKQIKIAKNKKSIKPAATEIEKDGKNQSGRNYLLKSSKVSVSKKQSNKSVQKIEKNE